MGEETQKKNMMLQETTRETERERLDWKLKQDT